MKGSGANELTVLAVGLLLHCFPPFLGSPPDPVHGPEPFPKSETLNPRTRHPITLSRKPQTLNIGALCTNTILGGSV